MTFDLASGRDPEPWGIEGAREALIESGADGLLVTWEAPPEAHPETDVDLLRAELDSCKQEIERLRGLLTEAYPR